MTVSFYFRVSLNFWQVTTTATSLKRQEETMRRVDAWVCFYQLLNERSELQF